MTPSNLDLARECGAAYVRQWDCNEIVQIKFTPDGLDAFAERIRADVNHQAMLPRHAQPAPAVVGPVAIVAVSPCNISIGWIKGYVPKHNDKLYAAPLPQTQQIAEPASPALKRIAEKLKRAGASVPAPENKGSIESAMATGLSIALLLVQDEIANATKEPS